MSGSAAAEVDLRLFAWVEGEDPATGGFTIDPAPIGNLGFQEDRVFLIQQPVGSGWTFLVDDEPLAEAPSSRPAWVWRPGFFAGEVTAELRDSTGATAEVYLLDVSPDPQKAGREVFQEMLDEIWGVDPQLALGTEPATTRVGALGREQNPFLELSRLRRFGPPFLRALHQLKQRPIRALRTRRDELQLHRIRRVDRHSARSAMRNPAIAAYLVSGLSAPTEMAHAPRLDVPVVEETYDSAANRCIVSMTQAVARRATGILAALQEIVDSEDQNDMRTDLLPRWPARKLFLFELARGIRTILRELPFSEVERPEITAAGLNAVSADPLYARAYSLAWKSLRAGVLGAAREERLWVSPTWEIYERWCFVRLASLLQARYPDLRWARVGKHPTGATAALRGEGNDVAIELLLQPRCPGGHQIQSHEFWSISMSRVPDLVMTSDDTAGRSFFVFDAKYRRSRASVLDAMTSAHVYRDSLRWGDDRPEMSLLLIPAGGGAPWLEGAAFHSQHRVGTHVFTPGGPMPVLPMELPVDDR